MPLIDHFHPPLSARRGWEGFHNQWAACISTQLNGYLPRGYFADAQTHAGGRVEVDVGTFEDVAVPTGDALGEAVDWDGNPVEAGGGVAVAAVPWAAPAVAGEFDAIFPDSIEIRIYSSSAGPVLVSAIELVSPANKDREDHCAAFADKCLSYLRSGVGVVTIDIVTDRHADLTARVLNGLGAPPQIIRPPAGALTAAVYRPLRRMVPEPARPEEPFADRLQVWLKNLRVGETLPTVPLPLDKGQLLPLELEASYSDALRRGRFPH